MTGVYSEVPALESVFWRRLQHATHAPHCPTPPAL